MGQGGPGRELDVSGLKRVVSLHRKGRSRRVDEVGLSFSAFARRYPAPETQKQNVGSRGHQPLLIYVRRFHQTFCEVHEKLSATAWKTLGQSPSRTLGSSVFENHPK